MLLRKLDEAERWCSGEPLAESFATTVLKKSRLAASGSKPLAVCTNVHVLFFFSPVRTISVFSS